MCVQKKPLTLREKSAFEITIEAEIDEECS